ncbi:glycoside hydrolase family 130 protein [Olivibacter sp. SDN3]|uniref:glycoside hydrolase family 130 protein n=1 Tax=Olivibacter sp. SDN3 TaxID=2764720 RepID=UPI0016518F8C|nr:glycoside hydrolase family 130 protein [Olivibacter sp. SDN3]QNL48189.1 glycoside hydrolase family 130 protein [Olivibacter sp. SDN3]
MSIKVVRKKKIFEPDFSRVIARFLFTGDERGKRLITAILDLTDKQQQETFDRVIRKYEKRHRDIRKIFANHFEHLVPLMKKMRIDPSKLPQQLRLLIGAYFTMEYSIEAAAFFNPSIVEHPDQTLLKSGQKRVIISFRATGEGHISSIVFRQGVLDKHNDITIDHPGKLLEAPEHVKKHTYHKKSFLGKLKEMCSQSGYQHDEAYLAISKRLKDTFTYDELKESLLDAEAELGAKPEYIAFLQEVKWLASSNYEMTFATDTRVCERVIFPIADTERNGIEDARFVRFVDATGEVTYYATYTAYDGMAILPKLLMTKDFLHFKVMPIHGHIAQNKGMALFPRQINGRYVMLCRIDGVNNYIAYSDNINVWREAQRIQTPEHPWELVQMGNCGSPLETEAGWLLITHGVGPMREYALGISLLDLDNPTLEIGSLSEPLLMPNREEREGYVPNVLYSCGAYIHQGELVIPYAMSDYASTYATVNVADLLAKLLGKKQRSKR